MPQSIAPDSQARLKAEGFPAAPLIEAVMEVQLEGGLAADESLAVADALGRFYPTRSETTQTQFMYQAETAQLDVSGRAVYRLEGEDDTEVTSIRPTGISVSQLAPYRSWDILLSRLRRDLEVVDSVLGVRRASRIGVRFINRIDVPLDENGIAEHEEYLEAHVRLPGTIPAVTNFYLSVSIAVPEVSGEAVVQSAVLPPAVEDKASFALDIDVSRFHDLAEDRKELLSQLSEFQAPKNSLYQRLLTKRALEEFS